MEKNKNLTVSEWCEWVESTRHAFEKNPISADQCLLFHNAFTRKFYLVVINKQGIKNKVCAHNTRDIYMYLLNNYCNKPNTSKGMQMKINVYYSDHAVLDAMRKGIKLDDGTVYRNPQEKHNIGGNVIAEHVIFRCIRFRWTSYYFGYTIDKEEDIFSLISDIKNRFKNVPDDSYRRGFTYMLKRKLGIDSVIKENFYMAGSKEGITLQRMICRKNNLGALSGCKRNIEHNNVYSYDIDSAYIAHLFINKFPSAHFQRVEPKEYKYKKGYTHFMLATVSIRVKSKYFVNQWIPVPAGEVRDDERLLTTATGKIIRCIDYVIGLWDEDLEILKEFYHIDKFKPFTIYEFKLMSLPQETLDTVRQLYITKTQKKAEGKDYHSEKIVLNRGAYGLWVTKRTTQFAVTDSNGEVTDIRTMRVQSDLNVPFQIGSYIVALQRQLLFRMIQKIGIDHVVAFHTDSIKTDIPVDDIIEEYNKNINICGKLGHFEKEWTAERCYFFNSVRYKALTDDGRLIVKHGGIDKRDMTEVFNMDYDDIQADTEITVTVPRTQTINAHTGELKKRDTVVRFGHMDDMEQFFEGYDSNNGELLAI